jgi:predicted CoA-binding protein
MVGNGAAPGELAGWRDGPLSSRAVSKERELRRLLKASSDRDNPSPDALAALLGEARHIAVVGLSRYLEKAARRVPSYLAAKGFDVIPVNPNAERLLGRRSYPTLEAVEESIDLVLVFRPSEVAAAVVEDALKLPGAPAIWLQTGVAADEAARAARSAGRTVVQDLCIFRVHRVLIG